MRAPRDPYYAVIFSSKQTATALDDYKQMAERMVELAKEQPGFIGIESARDATGFGITVSYWKSEEDIRRWKNHSEHLIAQEFGRTMWYESFHTRVCKVEREYTSSLGNSVA